MLGIYPYLFLTVAKMDQNPMIPVIKWTYFSVTPAKVPGLAVTDPALSWAQHRTNHCVQGNAVLSLAWPGLWACAHDGISVPSEPHGLRMGEGWLPQRKVRRWGQKGKGCWAGNQNILAGEWWLGSRLYSTPTWVHIQLLPFIHIGNIGHVSSSIKWKL